MQRYQRRAGTAVTVVTVHQDENETAALLRMADLGVRLPVLQDGRRSIAAALGVPNVMPATVVLRRDGSVARVLPQAFTSADRDRRRGGFSVAVTDDGSRLPVSAAAPLSPAGRARPGWRPWYDNVDRVPHAYRRRVPPELLAALSGAGNAAEAAGPGGTPRCWCCSPVRTPSTRRGWFPTMPTCC